ncbi:cupin [Atopobium sp. oral taxon 416]|uniref:cupin n=1 Tax=Atopobium sp. oral taxon 416 TaxID=712157 RepID=UPI001BABC361|nr:cupin [Atopobium sp. oral taxon 416]QUC04000.1 cupin [Atopobium sp. oral taxon 416]
MSVEAGKVFSVVKDNPWVEGCTLSSEVMKTAAGEVQVFSLAPHTRISPESYANTRLWYVESGTFDVERTDKQAFQVHTGELYAVPLDEPIGITTEEGCIYLELSFPKGSVSELKFERGSAVKLASHLPYQQGKIINMDLMQAKGAHFALMSFFEDTALSEHAAPGRALVFDVAGSTTITYNGTPHKLTAGEHFIFDKGGKHVVHADTDYTMALLILDD